MSNLVYSMGTLHKKAQGQPGEGPSFEQQFGILANAQITDKYPALSPFKIAFQLQDKNDDNTFAVGASVYKLGTNFTYIPAVFRNGRIWTGVIQYVPDMDRFLPLSDAWLSYIKNHNTGDVGDTVPAEKGMDIAADPSTARAKDTTDPFVKTGSAEHRFALNMEDPYQQDQNVFVTALKMGKKASMALLNKLEDNKFINDVLRFYEPEQLQKFASAAQEFYQQYKPTAITVFDKRASLLTDAEREQIYKDGFIIKNASETSIEEDKEGPNVIRINDPSNLFITPHNSCKCDILMPDGSLDKDVTVILVNKQSADKQTEWIDRHVWGRNRAEVSAKQYLEYNDNDSKFLAVIQNGTYSRIDKGVVALASSVKPVEDISGGHSTDSVKRIPYESVIVTPSGTAYMISDGFEKDEATGEFFNRTNNLLFDDPGLVAPIVGKNVIAFPAGSTILFPAEGAYKADGTYEYKDKPAQETRKHYVRPGNLAGTIDKFVASNFKRLKVYSDGNDVQVSGDKSPDVGRMQTKQAALHLVSAYGLNQHDAKTIISQTMNKAAAAHKPVADNFYIEKTAAVPGDSPDWEDANIGMSIHQQQPPEVTKENLTDYAGFNDPNIDQDIAAAVESGIKQVFDMQTLKLLAEAADPAEEVMDSIPDFMNCLDKLGRLLYLYHTHMDDLEEKYGAVKMDSLSRSLENTLKDLSELTVFLKLRGLGNDTDNNPDAGELQTGSFL